MRSPHRLVRVAAVGCSVLLAAGFISYRAGAFDGLLRPTTIEPAPAPVESPAPAEPAPANAYLGGSKSLIIAPVQPSQPGGSAASPAPVVLPGSKSAPVFEPAAPKLPAPTAPPK